MPNIAIYEGGKAARMNGVSRITTDDGNDGKIVWVPQSDRQTGTLYVSENGTYRAEDEGLHSWSKVTVRLAGAPLGLEIPTLPDPVTGAEIPTGEEGELEPVAPAGLEPIDEDAEIVNADDIDPDDPDAIEELADELGVSPEDIIVVDPEDPSTIKEAEPKPKGNGQEITGKDPETGDTETIGVNPDGTVSKDEAIAEIRLYTDPSKLMYHDGESIDFTGMEFAAYGASGRLLKVFTWPDPKISTPVTVADMNEVESIDVTYEGITVSTANGIFFEYINPYSRYGEDHICRYPANCVITSIGPALGSSGFNVLYASKNENASVTTTEQVLGWRLNEKGEKVYTGNDETFDTSYTTGAKYINAGKTVYYANQGRYGSYRNITGNVGVSEEAIETAGLGLIAWILIYGGSEGGYRRGVQNIPVSYNGHDDYFQIWVS